MKAAPHARARTSATIAALCAVVMALSACTASDGFAEPAEPAEDPDVGLVGVLAEAGIAVYADDAASAPLADVAEPRAEFALLESQAEVMAAEVAAGGGMTGAELDAVVEPTALTEDAEALPASLWVVAWAQAADTRASRAAKVLLGEQDWARHEDVMLPSAVLALFAADAATPDGLGADAEALGAPMRVEGAVARAAPPDGICEEALAFIDDVISRFFRAIGKVSYVGIGGGVIGRILSFIVNAGVTVINYGIEKIEAFVKDGVRVLLAPVLAIIGRIASVAAIVAHVFSSARPWSGTLTPDPARAALSTTVAPGAVALQVTTIGPTDWPPHVVGCARAAGVALPSLKPSGATVQWSVEAQHPFSLVGPRPSDARLDDDGRATWRYETLPEAEDVARGKVADDGAVTVRAHVRRDDLDRLQALIAQQILGFIPQPISDYAAPVLRPILDAQLERLRSSLDMLHDTTIRGVLPVSYHVPDEEPAEPPPDPGGRGGGSAVRIPVDCPPAAAIGAYEGPYFETEAHVCGYFASFTVTSWLLVLGAVPADGTLDSDGMTPTRFPGAEAAWEWCDAGCGLLIVSRGRYLHFAGGDTHEETAAIVRDILAWTGD